MKLMRKRFLFLNIDTQNILKWHDWLEIFVWKMFCVFGNLKRADKLSSWMPSLQTFQFKFKILLFFVLSLKSFFNKVLEVYITGLFLKLLKNKIRLAIIMITLSWKHVEEFKNRFVQIKLFLIICAFYFGLFVSIIWKNFI